MSIITILDPLIANQIAAGEVVERPVSVVKELLENAIDAGSTRIKVNIQDSGLKYIEVSDNGRGMNYEDLTNAIRRHATSKIQTLEDLNHLKTLGFRGEALPSIAAVSKLVISSRINGSPLGYEITVVNGKGEKINELGRPVGTTVTVTDLFYNTPARKKFLKAPSTELGHITDMVGRIALSKPSISFELNHQGKRLLHTPGNNDFLQTIYCIYGNEIARNIELIDFEQEDYRITGYITLPKITRSSRHYYNFFVNGRIIRSQELAYILEEFYYTRIPAKKYPVAIIHFTFPPESFDVNVHPAKLEIKFRDLSLVKGYFLKALSSVSFYKVSPLLVKSKQTNVYKENHNTQQVLIVKQESNLAANYNNGLSFKEDEKQNTTVKILTFQDQQNTEPERKYFFSSLKVIGQLRGTYIIATGEEGIYIIDQHAAHERIRYEKIKGNFLEQPSTTFFLSVPIILELTHQQSFWLIDNIVELANLGFVIEHFGNDTFLLRGVPKWNAEGNSHELLLSILEKIGSGQGFSLDKIVDRELFTLACKSSVKANQILTESDINYLLQQLDLAENPYSCPHGRPVMIKLTLNELQKRFLRT